MNNALMNYTWIASSGPSVELEYERRGAADVVRGAQVDDDVASGAVEVLLLEAGGAYGVDGYRDDLLDAAHVPANPEHEWGYTARGGPTSPETDAARDKVLGGCSAHNATVAMRARPSDIRAWREHGLDVATASDLASYGHPTATAPIGGPQDPGPSWTRVALSKRSTGRASRTPRSCRAFRRPR